MDRKAIARIATLFNEARIAADAEDATAPQKGAYGHAAAGLRECLDLLTDSMIHAEVAYQALLDGATVEQALAVAYSGLEPDEEEAQDVAMATTEEIMALLEPTWGDESRWADEPTYDKHDWEPGSETSPMQTDPRCRICGEGKRSPRHT